MALAPTFILIDILSRVTCVGIRKRKHLRKHCLEESIVMMINCVWNVLRILRHGNTEWADSTWIVGMLLQTLFPEAYHSQYRLMRTVTLVENRFLK